MAWDKQQSPKMLNSADFQFPPRPRNGSLPAAAWRPPFDVAIMIASKPFAFACAARLKPGWAKSTIV